MSFRWKYVLRQQSKTKPALNIRIFFIFSDTQAVKKWICSRKIPKVCWNATDLYKRLPRLSLIWVAGHWGIEEKYKAVGSCQQMDEEVDYSRLRATCHHTCHSQTVSQGTDSVKMEWNYNLPKTPAKTLCHYGTERVHEKYTHYKRGHVQEFKSSHRSLPDKTTCRKERFIGDGAETTRMMIRRPIWPLVNTAAPVYKRAENCYRFLQVGETQSGNSSTEGYFLGISSAYLWALPRTLRQNYAYRLWG